MGLGLRLCCMYIFVYVYLRVGLGVGVGTRSGVGLRSGVGVGLKLNGFNELNIKVINGVWYSTKTIILKLKLAPKEFLVLADANTN